MFFRIVLFCARLLFVGARRYFSITCIVPYSRYRRVGEAMGRGPLIPVGRYSNGSARAKRHGSAFINARTARSTWKRQLMKIDNFQLSDRIEARISIREAAAAAADTDAVCWRSESLPQRDLRVLRSPELISQEVVFPSPSLQTRRRRNKGIWPPPRKPIPAFLM